MEKIKFRGKNSKGEYFYGDLLHKIFGTYIGNEIEYFEVLPESVQQFCGYDAEGNEVYDGDQLLTDDGDIIYAQIDVLPTANKRTFKFSEMAKKHLWVLHE